MEDVDEGANGLIDVENLDQMLEEDIPIPEKIEYQYKKFKRIRINEDLSGESEQTQFKDTFFKRSQNPKRQKISIDDNKMVSHLAMNESERTLEDNGDVFNIMPFPNGHVRGEQSDDDVRNNQS